MHREDILTGRLNVSREMCAQRVYILILPPIPERLCAAREWRDVVDRGHLAVGRVCVDVFCTRCLYDVGNCVSRRSTVGASSCVYVCSLLCYVYFREIVCIYGGVIGYPGVDDRGGTCTSLEVCDSTLLDQVLFRSLSEGVAVVRVIESVLVSFAGVL